MSLAEAAKLDSFRELVTELQKLQGKAGNPPGHLVSWTTTDMQDMRKLMDKMDELMQGVALEKKQHTGSASAPEYRFHGSEFVFHARDDRLYSSLYQLLCSL